MTQTTPSHRPRTLVDSFGRQLTYLRVAVTDHCNLRCVYCMPEEGIDFTPNDQVLSNDEIMRVVRVAASLGVTKVRFTGGEPLIRKGIIDLVRATASTDGVASVHLTTNGILFPRVAEELRDAGLSGVNISLDTLKAERFKKITRRVGLDAVLNSVERAIALDYPSVKLNVVAMRGFNDDEICDFVDLTRTRPITVRFIELMPFDAHQIWKTGRFFGTDWILGELQKRYPTLADSRGSRTEHHTFRVPDHAGKVAVIPAYTRSLCGACNRLRVTADGVIRNCLYSETPFDLRAAMRNGDPDEKLIEIFENAVAKKMKDGWDAQRATDDKTPHRTSMTQIGG